MISDNNKQQMQCTVCAHIQDLEVQKLDDHAYACEHCGVRSDLLKPYVQPDGVIPLHNVKKINK